MDRDWAHGFVEEWVQAWNDHDLDRVLEHFADDVVFTSPVAALLVEASEGVIRGRPALRHYWSEGLRRIPDLHFEVVGVYVGVRTLVISYRNQRGGMVSEVLTFAGELAVEGHGTYMGDGTNPAGARTD